MLTLILVSSTVWFGIGILIGWRRARIVYWSEFERLTACAGYDAKKADRKSGGSAFVVLYGWTVAGLLGALVWCALSLALLASHISAEEHGESYSRRRKPGTSDIWILLGFLILGIMADETKRSIERNADDFVVKLSVFLSSIAVLVAFVVLT
jgi:hypothetical protein